MIITKAPSYRQQKKSTRDFHNPGSLSLKRDEVTSRLRTRKNFRLDRGMSTNSIKSPHSMFADDLELDEKSSLCVFSLLPDQGTMMYRKKLLFEYTKDH